MGSRKRNSAEIRKTEDKNRFWAKLNNCPSSPRKMRLVIDLIRGREVNEALDILSYTNKEVAGKLKKLLKSAISNFEVKTGMRAEDSGLFISKALVNEGKMLKRLRPAPQGRAYRIRKRSNHVMLEIRSPIFEQKIASEQTENNPETENNS